VYSLESPLPERHRFDLKALVNMPYRTDVFQTNYFIIEKYQDLFNSLKDISWPDLRLPQKGNAP
jgi:phenylalanine-4-hydroxylase